MGPVETQKFVLAGNGAMIEEFASALGEIGVPKEAVYEEPYFNARHAADRAIVESLAARLHTPA
jgi:hypothetical protein